MKHNFGAGPGILPHEVLKQAAAAVVDFNGTGLSLLEISHRSPEFEAVLNEAVKLVKELFEVPSVPGAARMFFVLLFPYQYFLALWCQPKIVLCPYVLYASDLRSTGTNLDTPCSIMVIP